jgi:serine/threonine protein kinase
VGARHWGDGAGARRPLPAPGGREGLLCVSGDGAVLPGEVAAGGGNALRPSQVVWAWAEDTARGLVVLHGLGITHTDLQPRNVFVDGEGRAVLGDFGTSLFTLAATSGGVRRSRAAVPISEGAPWTPPEIRRAFSYMSGGLTAADVSTVTWALLEARLSPKEDVWALGCILLQLLLSPDTTVYADQLDHLAALEFPARERKVKEMLKGIFGDLQDGMEGVCAERLAALIAKVLTLDPSLRPSAAQLLPPSDNPDLPCVGSRVVARPELLEELKRAVLEQAQRVGHGGRGQDHAAQDAGERCEREGAVPRRRGVGGAGQ